MASKSKKKTTKKKVDKNSKEYKKLHPIETYSKTLAKAKITNTGTKRGGQELKNGGYNLNKDNQVFSPKESFSTKYAKADKALHYAHNMTTKNHIKNVQTNFDRLYSVYPEIELDTLYQYIFIVRPDLNIYTSDGKELVTIKQSGSKNDYKPNSAPGFDLFFKDMHKRYPYILKSLTSELSSSHDFIPYLVGRTESLQLPDYSVKQYKMNQPYTDYNLPYAGNGIGAMTGGSFDITFREDNELRIHKLFQAWVYYINNVTRNIFGPKTKHLRLNKIDYATSVYCITCKADAETIVHWAKYTGAYPTNVPNSDMSFNLRGGVNNKMTVSFDYFLAEVMDPYILIDFNKNAGVDKRKNLKQKYIATYRTESLKFGEFKDYRTKTMKTLDKSLLNATVNVNLNDPMVIGNGNGLVGCPFIVQTSNGEYKLRWKNLSKDKIKNMAGLI